MESWVKLAAEQKNDSLFLRALRDVGRTPHRQKEYEDGSLDPLFNAARYHILSDDERAKYEENMTTIDDIHAYYREEMARELAEKVAEKVAEVSEKKLAEGMEKGIAEGMEKSKTEIAKNFLAAGIDIAVISSCTGLSEEQIKAL